MGHVNQREDQGRGMGILCPLAKFITDTALERFPRYIVLSILRSSLAPSRVDCRHINTTVCMALNTKVALDMTCTSNQYLIYV